MESVSRGSSIQSGGVSRNQAGGKTHAEVDLLTLSREHGWREGRTSAETVGDEIRTAVDE